MYDIVSLYFDNETIRHVSVWTLGGSAVIIFFMAFAVTEGAGFHCPLALLRGAQRFFLCALSIAQAYVAAFIVYFVWTPPGPFVLLFISWMLVTLVSAIRHLMSPAIAADNTWTGAWRVVRDRTRKGLVGGGNIACGSAPAPRRRQF